MTELLEETKVWLDKLSDIIPVDVMPGDTELSNQFLPQ
jgi:DNA polymerase II small subunit/DNA polymerase delta subunit B